MRLVPIGECTVRLVMPANSAPCPATVGAAAHRSRPAGYFPKMKVYSWSLQLRLS